MSDETTILLQLQMMERRLTDKLDTKIGIVEYTALVNRVEILESEVKKTAERITDYHNKSMEWVNEMFDKVTQMIHDENEKIRIDERNKQVSGGKMNAQTWIQLGFVVLACVLSVIGTRLFLH